MNRTLTLAVPIPCAALQTESDNGTFQDVFFPPFAMSTRKSDSIPERTAPTFGQNLLDRGVVNEDRRRLPYRNHNII